MLVIGIFVEQAIEDGLVSLTGSPLEQAQARDKSVASMQADVSILVEGMDASALVGWLADDPSRFNWCGVAGVGSVEEAIRAGAYDYAMDLIIKIVVQHTRRQAKGGER